MQIVARYLLCILIAVLPMQGSAAAFMALAASQAASGDAMVQDGHCDKVLAAQHHATTDADADAGEDAGNVHSKCSSCASCCIGACAPPVDYSNPALHPQLNDSHASLEPAMTTFISATLERPPRLRA
jgi:hypothetical protein